MFEKVYEKIASEGWRLEELPSGKAFTTWNGKNVRGKRYTVGITLKGICFAGTSSLSIFKKLHDDGHINLSELGFTSCNRCSGTGYTSHTQVYGGVCFKCRGFGWAQK